MSKVLLVNEVDFSKLSFDKKKSVKKGGGGPENCKIFYNNNDFALQVPRIKCPFGLSVPKEEFSANGEKYSLELSLDTKDEKVSEFKQFLEKLDDFNINYISANSTELLGSESTPAEIKKHKLYTSVIRYSVDKTTKQVKDYPGRFKVKLQLIKGKPTFKVYNEKKEEIFFYKEVGEDKYDINWDWAQKRMEVIPIIHCEGLWIINGKVYCGWRVILVRVFHSLNDSMTLDSFRDNGDSEDNVKENVKQVENEVSEEEEQEQEEEEEEEEEE